MINFEKAGDIYVTYTADGDTWNYSKSDANPRRGTESIVYELRGEADEQEEFFEIRLTRENDKVLVHFSDPAFVENVFVEPILEDGMWTIDIVDSEKHIRIQVENLAENDEPVASEKIELVTSAEFRANFLDFLRRVAFPEEGDTGFHINIGDGRKAVLELCDENADAAYEGTPYVHRATWPKVKRYFRTVSSALQLNLAFLFAMNYKGTRVFYILRQVRDTPHVADEFCEAIADGWGAALLAREVAQQDLLELLEEQETQSPSRRS